MIPVVQTLPLLPDQEELREVDCGVEKLEQVISKAEDLQKEEEATLFDEIENIHRL